MSDSDTQRQRERERETYTPIVLVRDVKSLPVFLEMVQRIHSYGTIPL